MCIKYQSQCLFPNSPTSTWPRIPAAQLTHGTRHAHGSTGHPLLYRPGSPEVSRWRLLLGFGIVNGGFSLVSCGVVHIIRRRVMDWLRVVDPSLDVKMVRKGTPLKTQGYRLRERLERGVGLGGLGLGIRRAWRFFVSGRDRAGDGACSQEGNKKLSEHFFFGVDGLWFASKRVC